MQMEHCSPVAYLRSLQTADDVEGCVRVLVHLQEKAAGQDLRQSTSYSSWFTLDI